MVGRALVAGLRRHGYDNLLLADRAEVDLTNQAAVDAYFAQHQPRHVLIAAAKVGGIMANINAPGEFIADNLKIQTNIIDAAMRAKVDRLLFMSSSCVYPRGCRQPMREDDLWSGPLEPTNAPYATAKLAGMAMCEAYNKQYGTHYFSVLPANLYGYNDNFHPENAHVLAAILRKTIEAKAQRAATITLWGSGTPKREFMFVDDLAEASIFLLRRNEVPPVINVGSGDEVTIAALAELVAKAVGYEGEHIYDRDKPDGVARKLLDNSRLSAMGWRRSTNLADGIGKTVAWYRQQSATANVS
jgi:GDP-L-fucose synthase